MPYRQTEGIAKGHAKGKVPSIPDYTTISRRINRLNIKVEDAIIADNESTKDNYIIIARDSTGIKVTNRGQWIRDKWGHKKRLFEDSHCSRCKKQENNFNDGNR